MIDIPVYDRSGKVAETLQFDESCLGKAVYKKLLHQAIVMYEANKRLGTVSTKTRREVVGTSAKPWKQKGTGRARVGTKRNPIWRGGGVVFGPKPRDFSKKMSKKARRIALKSALLAKLRDDEFKVVTEFAENQPKTKAVAGTLKAIGVRDNCLVVTIAENVNTYKSVRNLPKVDMMVLKDLNAYDALRRKTIVITKEALLAIPEELK